MKKLDKILMVTVFLCALPVANLFALSLEAQNAIEAMRAKLLADEKEQEAVVEPEYVPGKELAAALERIRAINTERVTAPINNTKVETEAKATDIAVPETEVVIEANADVQVIDQTDVEALEDITNNLAEEVTSQFDNEAVKAELHRQNQEAIEAMRARMMERNKAEAPVEEPAPAEEPATTEEPVAAEEKSEVAIVEEPAPAENETEAAKDDDYVPGQLLERIVAKYKKQIQEREAAAKEEPEQVVKEDEQAPEIQPQEVPETKSETKDSYQTMEKANQEIEEIFNNPEKRAEIAEKGRKQVEARKAVQKKEKKKAEKPKAKQKAEEDSEDSKQIDDERFNDYISRYNFKMPENYRIIVE